MKKIRLITGIVLVMAIICSLAACGNKDSKNAVKDENGTEGYIFRENNKSELGTPDKPLDPQKIYKNLTYTPQMFYGTYRMLGGDEGVEKYKKEMDYVDYKTKYFKKITAIPYELHTGNSTMAHSINYVEGYNWTRAYYQTDADSLIDLICAYEVDGNTITLKPLETWNVDKENNKITYTFSEYEFEYEFSFRGRDLTFSKDGKSVTMRSGLDVSSDDPLFHVDSYLSAGSEKFEDIDHITMHYDTEGDDSYVHLTNVETGKTEYDAVAKLSDDGLFTISIPKKSGSKTYQFVYFYCDDDGIVFTDGETTYYYNDSYSDYYKTDLNKYLSEEDIKAFDSLSKSQIEEISKKKTDLLKDLAAAFKDAGIKVTVNETNGELAMDASVLFGGDSAVLTDTGKDFLKKFIGVYTDIVFSDKYKGFVSKTKIEGHTAPVAGGTYEGGLPLSEERADAVKNYCLSAESGVDAKYISELTSTLEAVGLSNSVPVKDKNGNVDMSASRRVSFRFIINIG